MEKNNYISDYCRRRLQTHKALICNQLKENALANTTLAYRKSNVAFKKSMNKVILVKRTECAIFFL